MTIFQKAQQQKEEDKANADTTTFMSCFRLPRKIVKMVERLADKHDVTKIFVVILAIEQLDEREK